MLLFETRLPGSHLMLHDQVVEVPLRVNCTLFVQARILHEIAHLIDQVFSHLEELGARHLVLSIINVCRRICQASRFKKPDDCLCVTTVLHAHQTLVVDRYWQLTSRLERSLSLPVFVGHGKFLSIRFKCSISISIDLFKCARWTQANRHTLTNPLIHNSRCIVHAHVQILVPRNVSWRAWRPAKCSFEPLGCNVLCIDFIRLVLHVDAI